MNTSSPQKLEKSENSWNHMKIKTELIQNLWGPAKTVLKGKFIAECLHEKKKENGGDGSQVIKHFCTASMRPWIQSPVLQTVTTENSNK
jgi:hypothetical protein